MKFGVFCFARVSDFCRSCWAVLMRLPCHQLSALSVFIVFQIILKRLCHETTPLAVLRSAGCACSFPPAVSVFSFGVCAQCSFLAVILTIVGFALIPGGDGGVVGVFIGCGVGGFLVCVLPCWSRACSNTAEQVSLFFDSSLFVNVGCAATATSATSYRASERELHTDSAKHSHLQVHCAD